MWILYYKYLNKKNDVCFTFEIFNSENEAQDYVKRNKVVKNIVDYQIKICLPGTSIKFLSNLDPNMMTTIDTNISDHYIESESFSDNITSIFMFFAVLMFLFYFYPIS